MSNSLDSRSPVDAMVIRRWEFKSTLDEKWVSPQRVLYRNEVVSKRPGPDDEGVAAMLADPIVVMIGGN